MAPPSPDVRPTDDQLGAWLDGELDAPTRQQVDAWLQQHPDEAARWRRWGDAEAALRQALDDGLQEPLPPHWRALALHATGDRRAAAARGGPGWPLAAGLALASALAGGAAGGGVAWWWAAPTPTVAAGPGAPAATPPTPWPRLAAAAHAVYVPEQRHPVEVAVAGAGDTATRRAQEAHLAGWLTRRLSVPVTLFDLQSQGFELVGGRLLPEPTGPSAQLMYQDAAGVRVTVYLRRHGSDTPAAFRYEAVDGLGLFYWVDGPVGYALVGALPRERLLALAQDIARQGG
ncbi:anti-sigma factor [Ideonella sp.]|uniref:anti-sigma factor family protein n=1 Tax=Ideonella sp. TaxID=1929293 RepID=UPI0035B2CF28